MSLAVFDVLHHFLTDPEDSEEFVDEHAVGCFVPGADVVDLADGPLGEHQVDARAVVVDVQPIALVQPVAVQRDLLAIDEVRGEERNRLLGVLVRPEVVGAPGDENRRAVRVMVRESNEI